MLSEIQKDSPHISRFIGDVEFEQGSTCINPVGAAYGIGCEAFHLFAWFLNDGEQHDEGITTGSLPLEQPPRR